MYKHQIGNKSYFYGLFIWIVLLFFTPLHTINAAVTSGTQPQAINTVNRIDISGGIVRGTKVSFSIAIPEKINKYLVVDRVVLKDKKTMLEKINFYCSSYTNKYKPMPVISFYVFEKSQWDDKYAMTQVLQSKDYIFAIQTYGDNPFTEQMDRSIYGQVSNILADPQNIKELLSIPKSQQIEHTNTVFIDGSPTDAKMEIHDGVFYIPLRAVCEKLGYTVSYNAAKGMITVEKAETGFWDTFYLNHGVNLPRGGVMLLVNGRTYVSSQYFLRVLNYNLEIDEFGNLYLVTS